MADAPGYDFDRRTAERIVRAVREVESRPRGTPGFGGAGQFGEPDPVYFRNDSASGSDIIPPYGVGAIIGATEYNGFPLLLIEKPSSNVRPAYLVNSNQSIPQSGHGLGYISGLVQVQYSTPPTTSWQTYGPTSGSWALAPGQTPVLAQSFGVLSSSTVAGSSDTPRMAALWMPPSTAADDVKLAVSSENSGAYASTLLTPFNDTPVYTLNQDFNFHFEPVGTTPNQQIRCFLDSDQISGYTTGQFQYLGHDSTEKVRWITPDAPSTGTDERLAATSENSGVYWTGLHNDYKAAAYTVNEDLLIDSELTGTTPSQTVRMYANLSNYSGWTGAGHQFFMTDGSAHIVFRNASGVNVTTAYITGKDLLCEPEVAGGDIFFFVDASDISGYSGSAQQFLAHDTSGFIHWTTISGGSTVADTDEKVAVSSNNTAGYLAAQLSDLAHSGVVLGVDWTIIGTTPSQTITGDVDLSGITGYSTSAEQALTHNGGSLAWKTISACTS